MEDNNWLELPRRELLRLFISITGCTSFAVSFPGVAAKLSSENNWQMHQYDAANTGFNPLSSSITSEVNEKWVTKIGGGDVGTPVVYDEHIYVVNHETDEIYAINKSDGSGEWVNQDLYFHNPIINGKAIAAPAVDEDTVYTGMTDEEVYALNKSDGSVKWNYKTNNPNNVAGYPTLYNNNVYYKIQRREGQFGNTVNSAVVCFNKGSGDLKWEKDLDNPGFNPLAISDDTIYDVHSDNILALDASDGTIQWESDELTFPTVPPTVADGIVYARDEEKTIALDAATGSVRWEWGTGGMGSVAVADDLVYITYGSGIRAVSADDGSFEWNFSPEDVSGSPSAPAVTDNIVYTTIGEKLFGLNSQDGSKSWEYELNDGSISGLSVVSGIVFLGDKEGYLYALTEEPNEPPKASFDFSPETPIVNDDIGFDASSSEDDGSISDYHWKIDESIEKSGIEVTHRFSSPGDHKVTLQVTDDRGADDTTTESIVVSRPNQVPEANFSVTPTKPTVGETVVFDGSASTDPDGDITSYEWDFNQSGEFDEEGEIVKQSFEEAGEKTVVLQVTDDDSLKASIEGVILVRQQQVNFELTGTKTNISLNDDALLTLSVVNFLTSDALTVQLLIETPSGIVVSSVSGADSGSNQYTAVETIEPASQSDIRIRLEANQPGEFDVTGRAIWYFGDNEDDSDQYEDTVTIQAEDKSGDSSAGGKQNDGSSSGSGPGFGVLGTLGGLGARALLKKVRGSREDDTE